MPAAAYARALVARRWNIDEIDFIFLDCSQLRATADRPIICEQLGEMIVQGSNRALPRRAGALKLGPTLDERQDGTGQLVPARGAIGQSGTVEQLLRDCTAVGYD